jgi:hypothetical protein
MPHRSLCPFPQELKPIAGIAATIDQLDLPCCVASSSQMERIRLSLTVTGLIDKLPLSFSATWSSTASRRRISSCMRRAKWNATGKLYRHRRQPRRH